MSVLAGVMMLMAGVVTVPFHPDSRGPPGNQAEQIISREKRDGGVITAATIGAVVTLASAIAKGPSPSSGTEGGCQWINGNNYWHAFCSANDYCPPNQGFELAQAIEGNFWRSFRDGQCATGRQIQCCKRNRDENGHVWAGEWESTNGVVYNCKVEYVDKFDYVCKGLFRCLNSETGKTSEWRIGYPIGEWRVENGKWVGEKDCRVLGKEGRKEGEAWTGKIVWRKKSQMKGQKWYKI